jgi:hypothetical protein
MKEINTMQGGSAAQPVRVHRVGAGGSVKAINCGQLAYVLS